MRFHPKPVLKVDGEHLEAMANEGLLQEQAIQDFNEIRD